MKKFVALILAVVMVFALATVASADNTATIEAVTGSNVASADVIINATPSSGGATKYFVKVSWDSLAFTYVHTNNGAWNPATHTYDNVVAGHWENNTAEFTVENHSNASIKFAATYAPANNDKTNGVTVTPGNYTVDTTGGTPEGTAAATYGVLNSAVGTPADNPPSGGFTITVGGAPVDETLTDEVSGSVKVTITEGT